MPPAMSSDATSKLKGMNRYDHPAPHVEVEIAHVLVATQPANDRQQRDEPNRRRDELLVHDGEKLAAVGQVLVATVVLQVGVGQERAGGVEDRRWRQHPLRVRVQERRVPRLGRQHQEPNHEHADVEGQHREAVLLPVLRAGVERTVDPIGGRSVKDPGHVKAQRDRQSDHQADREYGKQPHGCGPFKRVAGW